MPQHDSLTSVISWGDWFKNPRSMAFVVLDTVKNTVSNTFTTVSSWFGLTAKVNVEKSVEGIKKPDNTFISKVQNTPWHRVAIDFFYQNHQRIIPTYDFASKVTVPTYTVIYWYLAKEGPVKERLMSLLRSRSEQRLPTPLTLMALLVITHYFIVTLRMGIDHGKELGEEENNQKARDLGTELQVAKKEQSTLAATIATLVDEKAVKDKEIEALKAQLFQDSVLFLNLSGVVPGNKPPPTSVRPDRNPAFQK